MVDNVDGDPSTSGRREPEQDPQPQTVSPRLLPASPPKHPRYGNIRSETPAQEAAAPNYSERLSVELPANAGGTSVSRLLPASPPEHPRYGNIRSPRTHARFLEKLAEELRDSSVAENAAGSSLFRLLPASPPKHPRYANVLSGSALEEEIPAVSARTAGPFPEGRETPTAETASSVSDLTSDQWNDAVEQWSDEAETATSMSGLTLDQWDGEEVPGTHNTSQATQTFAEERSSTEVPAMEIDTSSGSGRHEEKASQTSVEGTSHPAQTFAEERPEMPSSGSGMLEQRHEEKATQTSVEETTFAEERSLLTEVPAGSGMIEQRHEEKATQTSVEETSHAAQTFAEEESLSTEVPAMESSGSEERHEEKATQTSVEESSLPSKVPADSGMLEQRHEMPGIPGTATDDSSRPQEFSEGGLQETKPTAEVTSCDSGRKVGPRPEVDTGTDEAKVAGSRLSVEIPRIELERYEEEVPRMDMGLHSPKPELKRYSRFKEESEDEEEEVEAEEKAAEAENASRAACKQRFSIDAPSVDRKKVRFLLPRGGDTAKVYYPGKIRRRRDTIVASSVQVYLEPPLKLVFHLIDAERFLHLTGKRRAAICHGLAWVVATIAAIVFILCFASFTAYLHFRPRPPLIRIVNVSIKSLVVLPLDKHETAELGDAAQYYSYNFTFDVGYDIRYENSNRGMDVYNEQMNTRIFYSGFLIATHTLHHFKVPRYSTILVGVNVTNELRLPLVVGYTVLSEFVQWRFSFTGDFVVRGRTSVGRLHSPIFLIRVLCFVLLTDQGIDKQECRNVNYQPI